MTKRPMFERREELRFFLSRVARMVKLGILEVHAFSILTTHFHLLTRSPEGRLGFAMCRIQSEYSARFNRKRGRDGPLVRGRYTATLVDSDTYRDNVIRYIDGNAVDAGLAAKPEWYRWSSAWWYGNGRRPPRWLERGWIDARLKDTGGSGDFAADRYREYFAPRQSSSHQEWIERRLAAGESAPDPLDDLIDLAPPRVRAWLQENAERADGIRAGYPVAPTDALALSCDARQHSFAALESRAQRRRSGCGSYANQAKAGLMLDLAGCPVREIAARLRCSPSTAKHWIARHRRRLLGDAPYAQLVSETVHSALQQIR